MDGILEIGVQATVKFGPFVDDTDGKTGEAAVALTDSNTLIAKNGGAFAAKAETTHPAVDAASPGGCYYDVILGTGDTDTLGILKVGAHIAGALPVWQTYQVVTHDAYQSVCGDHVIGAAAVSDIHTDVGTVITNIGTVDTVVNGIATDVTAVHTHVGTIDGHITADYGATEKACIDLLDDANGLVNIHDTVDTVVTNVGDMHTTDLPDLHTDVGTVLTRLGTIVNTGGTASVGAILGDFANTVLTTRVADLHTDVGTAQTMLTDIHATDLPAVKADTAAVLADTAELQAEWANGGRLDLILDSAGAAGDPWTTALPGAYGAGTAGKIISDILTDTGTTLDAALTLALKLLRNKVTTDPTTGIITVYDDNGTTPLYTANVYEDVAGTMPFDGSGANRRDRLA